MPFPTRRTDDADVIRARLRRLLADAQQVPGWVPEDDPPARPGPLRPARVAAGSVPAGPSPEPRRDDPTRDGGACDDACDADASTEDFLGHGAHRSPAARERVALAAAPEEDCDSGVAPDDVALPAGMGRHRSPGPAVRWSPGRPGARSLWLAGIGAALVLVVWTWLDRPQVQPPPPSTPAPASAAAVASSPVPVGEASDSSPTVVVSVVGLVARPGLVTLPTGARVADAVEAAGGLLPEADAATINLAALVSDGQQIAVGVPGAAAAPEDSAGGAGGLVDLNAATAAELDGLPGIGPVLAERIVDHRTSVGPFASAEELDDVPGIGPTIAAELADLVTV